MVALASGRDTNGTIKQAIVPTTQFSREAFTNETAGEWRAKLGVGTGGEFVQTNISYPAVTNAPWQWGTANGTNWGTIGTNVLTNYTLLGSSAMKTPGYMQIPPMPSANLLTEWEVGSIILTNGDAVDSLSNRIHIGAIVNLNDRLALYYGHWTNKTLTGPANRGTIKMAVSTNINDFNGGKIGEVVTTNNLTSASGPNPYRWVSGPNVRKIDGIYWMTAFAGTNHTFESETSCGVLLYSTNGTNWVEAPSSPYAPFAVPAGGLSYSDWDVRNVFGGTIMKVDDLWYIHYIAYENKPLGATNSQYGGGLHYATSTNPMVAGSWVRAVGDWAIRTSSGGQDLDNHAGIGAIARLSDGRWLAQVGQRMAISTNAHPTNFVATSSWLNTDLVGWDVYWGFNFIDYEGLVGIWDSHKGPPHEPDNFHGGDYLHLLWPKATARPVSAQKLSLGGSTITNFNQIVSSSVSPEEVAAIMLTNSIPGSNIVGSVLAETVGDGSGLTNLNASELTSGTIPPDRVTLGWKTYNVLDYGADPTGTTTGNETNIQAAIDAACIAGGRAIVYIPPGLYLISNQIGKPGYTTEGRESTLSIWTNNVYLKGAGLDVSVLRWGNHGPPPIGLAYHNGIGALQVSNIGVFDLTFDGGYNLGATNLGDITQWYDSAYLYWVRSAFRNVFVGEGADADGVTNAVVSGCIFENLGSGGVSMNGPEYLGTGGDGDYILIEKSTFINNATRSVGDAKDRVGIKAGGTLSSTFIRDCRFFETGYIKTAGLRTFVTGCEFNSLGANSTNLFTASGQLSIINCEFLSTNAGGTHIFADSGTVEIRGSTFRNKPALWQVARQNTILANNIFPEYARTEPSIRIYGESGNHTYSGNVFLLNANDAIRVYDKLTNSLFVGNNFANCSFTFDNTYDHSSSNNVFSANQFGVNVALYRTRYNTFIGNIIRGSTIISTSSAENRFLQNTLGTITYSSAQPTIFKDNVLTGTITGGNTASNAVNASFWEGNQLVSGAPAIMAYTYTPGDANSGVGTFAVPFVVTTNYQAWSVDSQSPLIFNGANITNTMPRATILNKRQAFTLKNINATALEVTNATGAQTFDGALRFSLPQYGSRTIISDGANWQTISVYP